jgi:ABC-type uncharacterized transport system permease subunit
MIRPLLVALLTTGLVVCPRPVQAQAGAALAGSALGAIGGATLTVGIVVAYHPYVTAGPHNGRLATGFHIVSPLRRAGAVVEGINSGRYRELRRGLRRSGVGAEPQVTLALADR